MEDPFYLVRDDVVKALSKTRGLFQRLEELERAPAATAAAERAWTENELRNALRSIEWDVEDLQETIGIVEKNQRQFRLEEADLRARRSFVRATKDEVDTIRERLSLGRPGDSDRTARQELEEADELPPAYNPLLDQPASPEAAPAAAPAPSTKPASATAGYRRLQEEDADDITAQEQQQERPGGAAGLLHETPLRTAAEADDQVIVVGDSSRDVEGNRGRPHSLLGRALKTLRFTSDKRQWTAIGVFSGVMVLVVLMFFFI